MDKLLPCPHCGGFDTLAVSGIQIGTKTTWRTICDAEDSGCGAQGGTALTKHAAAAAWNRRTADPALLALAKLAAEVLRESDEFQFGLSGPAIHHIALGGALLDHNDVGMPSLRPGIADAIARLLAPDGAGEVADG